MFGKIFVKAFTATVTRPSPAGPAAAVDLNWYHTGTVSQYIPPPPRITVFLSLPSAQANPIIGPKFFLFDSGAPSPEGTPPVCPSRMGARYFGNGIFDGNSPVSML